VGLTSGCESAAGLSKKTAHALEQDRPDLLKCRQDWFDDQLDLDPARLVFIDETGLSTKMSRLRGRAPCGDRCRSPILHGRWKTTTFTGALRLSGMSAPMVLDGAMNGVAFQAYVQRVLIPTLVPGDIVVMDNLPAHKAEGVRLAIEDAGCRLPVAGCFTFLHTVPTSTPSRRHSRSSRPSCAPKPSERSTADGIPLAKS